MAFCGFFYAMRAFRTTTDSYFMNFEQFNEVLDSGLLPARFVDYVEHTYIPTKEEIEESSALLENSQKNGDE